MSSDFNVNVNDLSDSQSITSRIKQSFYPNNTQVIKGTSQSQSGEYGRSLIARDPSKVLQGDGLYRNPAFAMAGYEQNVQSSLHAVLAMGADVGDNVKIADPDNPGGPPLTGAQARLELARKSVMSTGFGARGFDDANASFTANGSSPITGSDPSTGGGGGSGGGGSNGDNHNSEEYETSPDSQVFNNQNRPIALLSQMSEEEKTAYNAKVNALLSKANFGVDSYEAGIFRTGFNLNLSKNSKNQILKDLAFTIKQSYSYKEVNGRMVGNNDPVPKELLGIGVQKCMMSAAIIELLNRLTDSIKVTRSDWSWQRSSWPQWSSSNCKE
jgi:hypothetical protein